MKYKGQEIKELNFVKAQVFDPPKRLLVWDSNSGIEPYPVPVVAVIPNREPMFRVLTYSGAYGHCAEIPESKLATYRELAQWLANANGELRLHEDSHTCYPYLSYRCGIGSDSVPSEYLVRKWSDTEWHSPTREYLGLED